MYTLLVWGTDVRELMRGLATLHKGPFSGQDNDGRPHAGEFGVSKSME